MKYLRTTLATIMAFVMLAVAMPGLALAGSAKLEVCHIPPGNPNNFHTITVSENALDAHLAHGDLEGGCFENCETLCDDGNACTQDVVSDPDQCICQPTPGPAVNCDDGNVCTLDLCDKAIGCSNDTEPANNTVCDDGDDKTVLDICWDGDCAGEITDLCADVVCEAGYVCNSAIGACDDINECIEFPGVCGADDCSNTPAGGFTCTSP